MFQNLKFAGFLFILIACIFSHYPSFGLGQAQYPEEDPDAEKYNKGVTVSPSHVNFEVDMGKISTQKIKVTNYTSEMRSFKVEYNDFDMDKEGKSSFLEAGSTEHSLSKYLNISPTFLEIEPGKSADVTLTVQLPNSPEANIATWGVLIIEEAKERQALDPGKDGGTTVAFGITPVLAFGIWLYQNPPNVEVNSIEITNFSFNDVLVKNKEIFFLELQNTGDGISFCNAYIELTSLDTGEQYNLGGKKYTILPSYTRTFTFELSDDIPSGKYSAVGVVDYYSNNEIVAAEMEVTIE
jgi:hypothetical protein